jgi:hypothetical protein
MDVCYARDCDTKVHSTVAFCKHHWRLVPPELKREWKRFAWAYENNIAGSAQKFRNIVLQTIAVLVEIEGHDSD